MKPTAHNNAALPQGWHRHADSLVAFVEAEYHVTRAELMSRRRFRRVAEIRHCMMYALRHFLRPAPSTMEIGLFFDRDHTTVLYALGKLEAQRQYDDFLESAITSMRHQLKRSIVESEVAA